MIVSKIIVECKDSIFFYSRSEDVIHSNIQYTAMYTEEYIADEWTKST